ncbi:winged helix-turn-helix domain-containing protein [Pseudarthrobacter sulfonivorans]|uniref:winged helix-turn-helix domain-containing protein n=1 Tax=Pseudarthrobacter sulfonivorans TaxID=121292 RepID=UPI00359370B1
MHRTRSRLIRFLITHGRATCDEIAAALDLSVSSARRHLALLYEAGTIRVAAGTYSAQPEQIEKQLTDLAASFQSTGSELRNRETDDSHFSVSAFHSSECPGTSKRTN